MHSLHEFLSRLVLEPGIFGAIGLFLVSIVDELVAFVPSSLILAAELLFLKDPLTLAAISRLTIFVGLPIALGTAIGSLPLYGIAYAGGKPAIEKIQTKWKFSWADVEKFERRFDGGTWKDELLFFFFRATPLMPTLPVTVVAGTLRMKPVVYTLLTILGIMVRVVITLIILRLGGEAVFVHALHVNSQ
ncbi:MAG: yngC1 [Parcubacteria group bacterium]|nr:yngC1 [Parcubacteria group bacterium]